MKKVLISLALVASIFAPSVAFASGLEAPADDVAGIDAATAEASDNPAADDPIGVAAQLIAAIRSGDWAPAIAFGLMLLVLGVRFIGGKWFPWLKTKPGGYVLGYGSAFALAVAGTLPSEGFSIGLLSTALMTAWVVTGGWSAAKDFVAWITQKVQG